MVEAARLGQLSTVRMLLDSGTATVEDRDEVSVCVCICDNDTHASIPTVYIRT